eukprot:g12343.t2
MRHLLSKSTQGPKALKAEMKRRRLAALTAATVASFKAGGRTEAMLGPADSVNHYSEGGRRPQEDDAVESGSDTDRTNGSSPSYGDLRRKDRGGAAQDGDESGLGSNSKMHTTRPGGRRDTLTLVSGMEVGGLGVDVVDATATASENTLKQLLESSNESTADWQTATARDSRDRATYRRWPEDESERIWRASLHGRGERECKGGNTTRSEGNVHADGIVERRGARKGSLPPAVVEDDQSTASATSGERREGVSTARATAAVSSSPTDAGTGMPASASRPGKLPTEVLASVLLSEHEFVGRNMSPAYVLERARQWEQQQRHHHHQEQQQRQPQATKTLPFPDLPYGFTDLGRRVNVEQPHRRGIEFEPTGGLAETTPSLE